jgi:hypothetical protein
MRAVFILLHRPADRVLTLYDFVHFSLEAYERERLSSIFATADEALIKPLFGLVRHIFVSVVACSLERMRRHLVRCALPPTYRISTTLNVVAYSRLILCAALLRVLIHVASKVGAIAEQLLIDGCVERVCVADVPAFETALRTAIGMESFTKGTVALHQFLCLVLYEWYVACRSRLLFATNKTKGNFPCTC